MVHFADLQQNREHIYNSTFEPGIGKSRRGRWGGMGHTKVAPNEEQQEIFPRKDILPNYSTAALYGYHLNTLV